MDSMPVTMLLSIGALAAHLVEEVATGFRRRFPLGEMPVSIFVGINMLVYAYSIATFILARRDAPLAVPLAWVWSLAMLLNGAGHTGFMLARRRYFPGGVTAPLLILAACNLIVHLAVGT
jgi:hypothetical protein